MIACLSRILLASAALLVASCNDTGSADPDVKAFDALGVKPLPAPAEYARQRDLITSVNKCLGLLEFAAGITDDETLRQLRERNVSKITTEEILPLLKQATEIERESSLMEHEINEITEKSRASIGPNNLGQRLDEIVECTELSRRESQSASR